jgi:nicotinic acid mononucleotide adenylyltransferase
MNTSNSNKHAFFTFGRFQPPTIGHGLLLDTIVARADAVNGDAYAFVSGSKDSEKNPLTVETKIEYLEKMHADKPIHFVNTKLCCKNNIFGIVNYLIGEPFNYTHIIMVIGSDRVETFRNMFQKYPDIFAKMSFVKAGNTRTTSLTRSSTVETTSNITSISGTAMRLYAANSSKVNDEPYMKFRAGVLLGSMSEENVLPSIKEEEEQLDRSRPYPTTLDNLP